jgi:hypothetical protein
MFKTAVPDTRDLTLAVALMLSDRFTEANELTGLVTVRVANQPSVKPFVPTQKYGEATFLFFDLPAGAHTLEIRSNREAADDEQRESLSSELVYFRNEPAYYLGVDIPIVLPPAHALWPAFPDLLLADQTKPLDDPTQPAVFRQQRAAAMLQPTTAYPFSFGATLVRGEVQSAGAPLADASVRRVGDDLDYRTGPDGQFVLFFKSVSGASEMVTLRASHAAHPDLDQIVVIRRGMTVVQDLAMAP